MRRNHYIFLIVDHTSAASPQTHQAAVPRVWQPLPLLYYRDSHACEGGGGEPEACLVLLVTRASSRPEGLTTAPPLAPAYTAAVVCTMATHVAPVASRSASTYECTSSEQGLRKQVPDAVPVPAMLKTPQVQFVFCRASTYNSVAAVETLMTAERGMADYQQARAHPAAVKLLAGGPRELQKVMPYHA